MINAKVTASIDDLEDNLIGEMTMTKATDSDEFLYVILKISTDLNDTLTTIDEEISSGISISAAFELYADEISTAITSATADLVEFE
jgi:hypothetical protein